MLRYVYLHIMKVHKRKSRRRHIKQARADRRRSRRSAADAPRRRSIEERLAERREALRFQARVERIDALYEDFVRRGRELDVVYTVALVRRCAAAVVKRLRAKRR